MAYATHQNVSDHMQAPDFSNNTTPTSTKVTAGIVQADLMIDNYIGSATVDSNTLQLASCMIAAMMIMRGRKYLTASEEVFEIAAPLMTSEVTALLDRKMETATEIPIIIDNLTGYQTQDSPDDFV